ncbi:MAG: VWA domain-containing protein [Lentisphaeraceae bacterium]|nr:VWA domain-containing protein [Lentisphaeraceae bacterium]
MIFRFYSPWLLLLLIPALILFIIQWRRRPPALVVSSVGHFTGKEGSKSPKLGWLRLPLILEFIAIILLITALARPQKGRETITSVKNGIDIAMCLDVSGSMEYFDPEESQSFKAVFDKINEGKLKPRIDVAKEEISRFVEKRPDDRLGLIVFASQPYQLCPLTFDKKLLQKSIEKAEIKMLGVYYNAGTGIAAPLATAIHRLKDSPAKRRVVILFTDGANNVDQKLTPEQAAELAAEFNITIYTVGIGSPSAVKLTRTFPGFRNTVSLKQAPYEFDEQLMKNLAEKTNGKYFHVKSREGFSQVMDEIDSLEKVEIKQPKQMNFKDLFPALLYSGFCLLGLSFLLNKTVMMRVP